MFWFWKDFVYCTLQVFPWTDFSFSVGNDRKKIVPIEEMALKNIVLKWNINQAAADEPVNV